MVSSVMFQVHYILAELCMGGMVLETNMSEILARIEEQNKLEKQEVSGFGADFSYSGVFCLIFWFKKKKHLENGLVIVASTLVLGRSLFVSICLKS